MSAFITLGPDVFFFFAILQVEEVKLSPGHMHYSYSTVYTSISGLRFSSSGVTESYHDGSNTQYYSLSRMCDGDLKNAYIVTSSYTNVVITVSLPRNMFIHHIRLYPVCRTRSFVLSNFVVLLLSFFYYRVCAIAK